MKSLTIFFIIIIVNCWGCAPSLTSRNPNRRMQAVERLADQTALANVAFSDNNYAVRLKAVERLTDQTALAIIADSDKECIVREEAVKRLSDQTALANIALSGKEESALNCEWDIKSMAVERLTDQTALAKVAVSDNNKFVKEEAVKRLTDQTALAKVAISDNDNLVREEAVKRLTDQILLKKLADEDKNLFIRRIALAVVLSRTEDIVMIKKFASLQGEGGATDINRHIARLRLAIREPTIVKRCGEIELYLDIDGENRLYNPNKIVLGEKITLRLLKDEHILAAMKWETEFPTSVTVRDFQQEVFFEANVDIETLLSFLFQSPEFAKDDFVELTHSNIPEVRKVAEAKLGERGGLY